VVAFITIAGWAFWRAVTEPVNHHAPVVCYVAVALAVFANPFSLGRLAHLVFWESRGSPLQGHGRLPAVDGVSDVGTRPDRAPHRQDEGR
jgi:hypothetical protein